MFVCWICHQSKDAVRFKGGETSEPQNAQNISNLVVIYVTILYQTNYYFLFTGFVLLNYKNEVELDCVFSQGSLNCLHCTPENCLFSLLQHSQQRMKEKKQNLTSAKKQQKLISVEK